MIGVLATPADWDVVAEFFQLFKTSWEPCQRGREYDVLLCSDETEIPVNSAGVIVVYGAEARPGCDNALEIQISSKSQDGGKLTYELEPLPIYGECSTLSGGGIPVLVDSESGSPAALIQNFGRSTIARVGYDLFFEVRVLLSIGQPVCNAAIPALDRHISVLRDLLTRSRAAFVEIPPVPTGYNFIACITHDVDHPAIRQHRFDHTALGFLYRAVAGSVFHFLRGRMSLRELITNWTAAVKLPFVYFGIAGDFWRGFDRYSGMEGGARSSFFVIPWKGDSGRVKTGDPSPYRAAGYGAKDIAEQLHALMDAGCEIGLHGIDAWLDADRGREELDEIRRVTRLQLIGVRMHWLYWDTETPARLEAAGADYDSTAGYNETVGYKSGTAQVYKPLGVSRLLELPLHIMDTALFLPGRLGLSQREARNRVDAIIATAEKSGGVVTVNWHDRSILPERLWGRFYSELLEDLKARGAWITTAGDAVQWFRRRRSVRFEASDGRVVIRPENASEYAGIPGLWLRHYPEDGRGLPLNQPTPDREPASCVSR
jgi:hypothetical protein